MDREALDELEESLEKYGHLGPLLVGHLGGRYVVIDGNYRLEALKKLGVKEVECKVVELRDVNDLIEIGLKFLKAKGRLSLLRLARLCRRLRSEGWKLGEIARLVGRSEGYVSDLFNLLYKVAEPLQGEYLWNELGLDGLRRLAKCSRDAQLKAWEELKRGKLPFRSLVQLAEKWEDELRKIKEKRETVGLQKLKLKREGITGKEEEEERLERPSTHERATPTETLSSGDETEVYKPSATVSPIPEEEWVAGEIEDVRSHPYRSDRIIKVAGREYLVPSFELGIVGAEKLVPGAKIRAKAMYEQEGFKVLGYIRVGEAEPSFSPELLKRYPRCVLEACCEKMGVEPEDLDGQTVYRWLEMYICGK